MKSFLLTTLFIFYRLISIGQDTIFYNGALEETNTEYHYFKILSYDQYDSSKVTESIYYKSGQLYTQKNFSDYIKKQVQVYKEWNERGLLLANVNYSNGKLHGLVHTFWENGMPKRIDQFSEGTLVTGKCYTRSGGDTAYYHYEQMPVYPGGEEALMKHLSRELKYPKKSRKKGIEGRVIVKFIINENGSVTQPSIVKSLIPELDQEAMRVVSALPQWQPGRQDGKPVKVVFNLPIYFKLVN